MAALVIGAVVLGSGSSWVMGFVPFLLAILGALVIGNGMELARGVAPGALPLPSLALLVAAQIAYGLGLLAQVGLARLALRLRYRPGAAPSLAGEERHAHERKAVDPAHHHVR